MVTLGLVFLMGILGLVVDVGWGYYRKQVAQAAADSAAMAAVAQAAAVTSSTTFTCGSGNIVCQNPTPCSSASTSSVITVACQYGTANGVTASNLYISSGTTDPGSGAAMNYWVRATVSEGLFTTFSRVMGINGARVAASAMGGVIVQNGSGGGCIYALDPNMAASLQVGGASLTSGCGIYVNSNDTGAMKVNGNNSYVDATGAAINVVGGWTCTNGCAYVKPPPNTGVSPADDPLGNIPPPSYSGCDHVNWTQTSNNASSVLNPGVYCGGIKISGGTVQLSPGNYILNGGGLSLQGSGTTVNGTGVFFYNTSNGYQVGNLAISGSPMVNLTAQTSGTYQGLLYFRDRSMCPSTNDAVTGNTNTVISGTFYVHCTNTGGTYVPAVLMFSGESTPGHYVALVADSIKITGNSHLILDPTGGNNTGIKPASKSTYLVQ